jgi:chromosome segregation ATPase
MNAEDKEEIKRHFDVVAEGLRSDIRLVADGVAMNTERLDRMDGRLDTMDGRLDAMDGRLDAMDGRLAAMDGRLDGMDGRLGRLEVEMRHGFGELRSMLKLSYAELEGRLTRLETAYDEIQERLGALESRQAS